jgi:hypothetical protein
VRDDADAEAEARGRGRPSDLKARLQLLSVVILWLAIWRTETASALTG